MKISEEKIKNANCVSFANDFMKVVEKSISEREGIYRFLQDLDSYSTETFNHSINVAAIVYSELSKNSDFSQEEVEKYTIAALVHDVGKLTVPLEVLHSTRNFWQERSEIDNDAALSEQEKVDKIEELNNDKDFFFAKMNMHSIYGYTKADEYGLTNTEKIIGLSHHMGENAIEFDLNNNDNNFAKSISKNIWKSNENKEYIIELTNKAYSYLSEKDLIAIDVTSLADITEALASERSYKNSAPWNDEHLNQLKINDNKKELYNNYDDSKICPVLLNNCNIVKESGISFLGQYSKNIVKKLFEDFETNKDVYSVPERNSFSHAVYSIEELNISYMTRVLVKSIDADYVPNFSQDKLSDIEKDPLCGEMFLGKQLEIDEQGKCVRIQGKTKLEEFER